MLKLFSKKKEAEPETIDHVTGVEYDSIVQPGGSFSAQFDITITRNTSNIAQNLECAVLGMTSLISGYRGFVQPTTGGTVAVTGGIYNTLPTLYRFTHVNGANTDTIDITSSTTEYPSLLTSSGFDLYRINNIRYSVSDSALATTQFKNKFVFDRKSIFGVSNANPVSVVSNVNPQNQLNYIVDIPIAKTFDKETMIILAMAPEAIAATAYSVTLSFFVDFFDKLDKSKLMA